MRRVLITHVDSPLGRRLTKALYHDPDVGLVLGVGTGPQPSFLRAYAQKCVYQRLDLAKARHLHNFFQSERFARLAPDSVVHLPFAREAAHEAIPGRVPTLVSETRRLLEACAKSEAIERFVYLSTGFVYHPEPGNTNVFAEDQELGLECDTCPEVRAWVDADLICQAEISAGRMQMTILRAAPILTEQGEFLNSPPLRPHAVPLGYDPVLSVVADRDVARALALAVQREKGGIFNVAATEVYPRSALARSEAWLGPLHLPAGVGRAVASLWQLLGIRGETTDFDRYGIVLSTRRAREELGFEASYRIEAHEGHLDTVRARPA